MFSKVATYNFDFLLFVCVGTLILWSVLSLYHSLNFLFYSLITEYFFFVSSSVQYHISVLISLIVGTKNILN